MSSVNSNTDWAAETPQSHANVFAMVHRLLRGRYLITIVLAGLFALAGAAAGYFSQKPLYRSDAIIQIQPVMPKILFETEQTSAPAMFASFVASQAELMSGQNVINFAMDSDRWREATRRADVSISSFEEFRRGLRVRTSRATQQLISVEFEHENAIIAHAATDSVVDAYMELYGRSTEISVEGRLNILEARRTTLRNEKNLKDAEIARVAREFGTDQLGPQMQAAFEAVQAYNEQRRALESQIEDLQLLTARRSQGDTTGLTPEQAAELDSGVAELLGIRRELEAERTRYIAAGILAGHRDYRTLQNGIREIDREIQNRIASLEVAFMNDDGDGRSMSAGGVTLDGLRMRLERVESRLREAREQQERLGQANLRLRDLNSERLDLDREISRTEQRIDALRLESQAGSISEVSGRVSVVGPATMPRNPSSDKRIKLAGAGFVGAGAVPVAAMLGLGLMGRRIRYSDDGILDAAHSRIVGVLPDLGRSITDRELAEASAFAVHQIRSQLQIMRGREKASVLAVTSPAPGDGKTSMIIALGLSFAESGDRTLLIDMDLIGRGLSLHFGHASAPSLAEAAASGSDLRGLVHESRFERLSVLPAGLGDELRISRLSPPVVRRLLDTFRDEYDTILIDSGPILGSIEAGLLAPAVDGVMMVVGRNQLRPLVKRAVDQIISVGGQVTATVFNRASIQELRQSSSSMSVHFSRQASRQAAEQAANGQTSIGPLGGSLFRPEAQARASAGNEQG